MTLNPHVVGLAAKQQVSRRLTVAESTIPGLFSGASRKHAAPVASFFNHSHGRQWRHLLAAGQFLRLGADVTATGKGRQRYRYQPGSDHVKLSY